MFYPDYIQCTMFHTYMNLYVVFVYMNIYWKSHTTKINTYCLWSIHNTWAPAEFNERKINATQNTKIKKTYALSLHGTFNVAVGYLGSEPYFNWEMMITITCSAFYRIIMSNLILSKIFDHLLLYDVANTGHVYKFVYESDQ